MWLTQAGLASLGLQICAYILVIKFGGVAVVLAQIKSLYGFNTRQPLGHGSEELWLRLCSPNLQPAPGIFFLLMGIFCVQHKLNMLSTWCLRPLL